MKHGLKRILNFILLGLLVFNIQKSYSMTDAFAEEFARELGEAGATDAARTGITDVVRQTLDDAGLSREASDIIDRDASSIIEDTVEDLIKTDLTKIPSADVLTRTIDENVVSRLEAEAPADATKLSAQTTPTKMESRVTNETNVLTEAKTSIKDIPTDAKEPVKAPAPTASEAQASSGPKETTLDTLKKQNDEILKNTKKPDPHWWEYKLSDALEKGGLGYAKWAATLTLDVAWGGLIMGFAFMFPNWIMQSIETEKTQKTDLANAKQPQNFGSLTLKIPNSLINSANPSSTIPVYTLYNNNTENNTDFFVATGSNWDDCGKASWGVVPMTSPYFASQMMHLNTGLEFYQSGDPTNPQFVYRQLLPLGTASSDKLFGCKNPDSVIQNYVTTILAPAVASGKPYGQSFDKYSGAYGQVSTTGGKTDPTTAANLGKIFNQVSRLNDAFALSQNPKITLQGLQLADKTPAAAAGILIYQTKNTPLAQTMGGDFADYVVALDNEYNLIPAYIPQISGGAIGYIANPQIRYLYSVLNDQDYSLFEVTTGNVLSANESEFNPSNLTPQSIIGAMKSAFDATNQNQIKNQATVLADRTKNGPFTFGAYKLTPVFTKDDSAPASLYILDPAKNNTQSTIKDSNGAPLTDYLVPTDAKLGPLASPLGATYLISMATSTIYNTNAVPVGTEEDFVIKSNGTLIKGDDSAQGNVISTNLGTAYQRWDVNPFNNGKLPNLPQNLAAAIKQQNIAGMSDAIANHTAALFVSFLSAAALTKDDFAAIANNQSVLNAIAKAIATSIGSGLSGLSPSAKTAFITNLFSGSSASKAATVSFKNVTSDTTAPLSNVSDALKTKLNALYNAIGNYSKISQFLVANGLIPVGGKYIYNSWGWGGSTPLSSYVAQNNPDINAAINASESAWAAANKLSWATQAAAMEQIATTYPRIFADSIPQIIIWQTDEAGPNDYVYHSSFGQPNDYYIVSDSPEPSAAADFDGQQYLISLTNGAVYQRQDDLSVISATDDNGNPIMLSNSSRQAIISTLNSALQSAISAIAPVTPVPHWPVINIGNFVLTINPTNVKNKVYVYEDITGLINNNVYKAGTIVTFDAYKYNPDVSLIPSFFVTAKGDTASSMTNLAGMPFDSAAFIADLTSGSVYDAKTGDYQGAAALKTADGKGLFDVVSSKLPDAIKTQVQSIITDKATALQNAVAAVAPKPGIDATTVSGVQNATALVPLPLSHLTIYNNTFYGSLSATGIVNYNVNQNVQQYDGSGNIIATYTGNAANIARSKLGLYLDGGALKLGVPNMQPNIGDMSKVTFNPIGAGLTAQVDSQQTPYLNDTYTIESFTSPQFKTNGVMAHTDKYYIDMYSGSLFDHTGNAVMAQYPLFTYKNTVAGDSIIGLLDRDANGNPQVFAQGVDGFYYYYNADTSATTALASQVSMEADPATCDQKNLTQTVNGFGLVSENSSSDSANLLAVAQSPFDLTKPFDTSNPLIVKKGSSGPFWDICTKLYDKPATDNAESLRQYEYIGSSSTATFSYSAADYQSNGNSYNPNYNVNPLIAGKGTGNNWSITRLYLPDQLIEESGSGTAGAFVEFTPAGTSATSGFNDFAISSNMSFIDSTYAPSISTGKDANTQAKYVVIKDDNGYHFYIPVYETVSGDVLTSIQESVNAYATTTGYGDVILVKPLALTNLQQIQAIVDVPEYKETDAANVLKNNDRFLFDPIAKRYIYQYDQSADGDKLYYSNGATYVDLRSGVLFDEDGKPLGTSISSIALQLLAADYNVGIPPFCVIDSGTGQCATSQPENPKAEDLNVPPLQAYTPAAGKVAIIGQNVTLGPTTRYMVYIGG